MRRSYVAGMTSLTKGHPTTAAVVAALLLALALATVGALGSPSAGPLAPAVAKADDDDNRGERRINRFAGKGKKACAAAKRRTGGGICTRVIEDRDDSERYEVAVRTRTYRYEIDLSRTYRVLGVDRDRIDDHDDDDDDDDNDDD